MRYDILSLALLLFINGLWMLRRAILFHYQAGNNAAGRYRSPRLRQIARGTMMKKSAKSKRNRYTTGALLSLLLAGVLVNYL